METNYEIDSLDRKILRELIADGRKPYLEIARSLMVSGGTIHQRVEKMQRAGVIKGFTAVVDREKLGHGVTVMVGIHLKNAKDTTVVLDILKKFPEVLETHFTSGGFALMAKVVTPSIQSYYEFLTDKLQALKELQSTESIICMSSPTSREIVP